MSVTDKAAKLNGFKSGKRTNNTSEKQTSELCLGFISLAGNEESVETVYNWVVISCY